MLNEKDLVTKYRDVIYQETGTWVMPSVEINENPSDRAMQLVLSTNRNLEAYGRTCLFLFLIPWFRFLSLRS